MVQKAYREEHVLLVLVDGPGVRHRVRVFDHRDGFTWKRPEARHVTVVIPRILIITIMFFSMSKESFTKPQFN